jgi:hypothetical protein
LEIKKQKIMKYILFICISLIGLQIKSQTEQQWTDSAYKNIINFYKLNKAANAGTDYLYDKGIAWSYYNLFSGITGADTCNNTRFKQVLSEIARSNVYNSLDTNLKCLNSNTTMRI